jgi:PPPDE putative peptidase domain
VRVPDTSAQHLKRERQDSRGGLLGVYHSGIIAEGVAARRSRADCTACPAVVFRTSVHVGDTPHSEEEVAEMVEELGEHYLGIDYHLLQMNCNHFSSDLCYALTGTRPPFWINRLAACVVAVHCLFPSAWLPPLNPPTMEPPPAVIAGVALRDCISYLDIQHSSCNCVHVCNMFASPDSRYT